MVNKLRLQLRKSYDYYTKTRAISMSNPEAPRPVLPPDRAEIARKARERIQKLLAIRVLPKIERKE